MTYAAELEYTNIVATIYGHSWLQMADILLGFQIIDFITYIL